MSKLRIIKKRSSAVAMPNCQLIYRVALDGRRLALVVLVHDCRRLLPVDPEVLLEVARLAEALPAGLAHVGPLPGVQALVHDHLVALRERLGGGTDGGICQLFYAERNMIPLIKRVNVRLRQG